MLADTTRPLRDLGGVGGAVKAGIDTNRNLYELQIVLDEVVSL